MDSHSIFVVQRTFTQVRRGYDPYEVDRHLELVAEMFNRGRSGEQRREAERHEAEARRGLDAPRLEAEATLEGARKRADAEIARATATLEAARGEAAQILVGARAEAMAITEQARREGHDQGEADAEQLLAAAHERAQATR